MKDLNTEMQKEVTNAILRSLEIYQRQDKYKLGFTQTSVECAVACLDCWAVILRDTFDIDGEKLFEVVEEAMVKAANLSNGRLTVV